MTDAFIPVEPGWYWWEHKYGWRKIVEVGCQGHRVDDLSGVYVEPHLAVVDRSLTSSFTYACGHPIRQSNIQWFVDNGTFHPTPIQPPEGE